MGSALWGLGPWALGGVKRWVGVVSVGRAAGVSALGEGLLLICWPEGGLFAGVAAAKAAAADCVPRRGCLCAGGRRCGAVM